MIINQPFSKKKVYFTSDNHFGHNNIIEYCDRPFSGNKEMTQYMIKEWNKKISDGDIVFHLGDLFLSSIDYAQQILNRLNGQIYLINGNHDYDNILQWDLFDNEDMFLAKEDLLKIRVNDHELDKGYTDIVMCHYPLYSWNPYGSWHLFGHVHGSIEHPSKYAYDVGVDTNEFKPLSYHEIKVMFTRRFLNNE